MTFTPLNNQYFDAVAQDPTTKAHQVRDHDYNQADGDVILSGKTCTAQLKPICPYVEDSITRVVNVCGRDFDYNGRQTINALNGIKEALYLSNVGNGIYNKPAVKAEILAHPCLEPKVDCQEC